MWQVIPLTARSDNVEHPIHCTSHINLNGSSPALFWQQWLYQRPLFIAQIAGISCLFVRHSRLLLIGFIGCLVTSNFTFQAFSLSNRLLGLTHGVIAWNNGVVFRDNPSLAMEIVAFNGVVRPGKPPIRAGAVIGP
jgi:hypothetical protein